ncbi:hypothetical protein FGO68_gene14899 [Halteria grandinella]|uniref:Uncharacterized protein n=1 Tax=Halteria grandinella TaxID=5974 RepID=A0A8J8NMK1_HALGN|nr:hypothetical protein FGO68_gene14899 [Halteria grandinella]
MPISKLVNILGLKIEIRQKKEYPQGHDESKNYCGGYQCHLESSLDETYFREIMCIKDVVEKERNVYDYLYTLGPIVMEDGEDIPNINNEFGINCTCNDQTRCFSNHTLKNNGTFLNSTDIIMVNYNSYFFDNIKEAKVIQNVQYIENNTAGYFTYELFQLSKTDALLPLFSPLYEATDYPKFHLQPLIEPLYPDYEQPSPDYFMIFSANNDQLYLDQYRLTPRSLFSGLSEIGGLMSFFGLALILLRQYHKRELNREIAGLIRNGQGGGDGRQASQVFSYERYAEMEGMVRQMQVEMVEIKGRRGAMVDSFNSGGQRVNGTTENDELLSFIKK